MAGLQMLLAAAAIEDRLPLRSLRELAWWQLPGLFLALTATITAAVAVTDKVAFGSEMIAAAHADMVAQADPDSDGVEGLETRYPGVQVRAFDGDPGQLTEMDALVAYLQMLGTLVRFDVTEAEALER